MWVYYDTNSGNQVVAQYSNPTSSTVWDSYTAIKVIDLSRLGELDQYGTHCQLTIVDGEVTAVTQNDTVDQCRQSLRDRVSLEYDQLVEDDGFAISWSRDADLLIITDQQEKVLADSLAVVAAQLAVGDILSSDIVLVIFKFADGVTKPNITAVELIEICADYKTNRGTWFAYHDTVKTEVMAGTMPASVVYTGIDLVASDFNGCNLS